MFKLYLFDLIIPMNGLEPIFKGFIRTADDRILEVGRQAQLDLVVLKKDKNVQLEDCQNGLALPGFLNNHVHLAYGQNYKFPQHPGQQLTWISELTAESRGHSSAQNLQIAKSNIQACLRHATSFVVENTPFDETARALQQSPLKALIGLEVFGNEPQKSQKIMEAALSRLQKLSSENTRDGLIYTLSPHSVYNVSAALFKALSEWAFREGKLLLTHLAEFEFESRLTQNGFEDTLRVFHESLKVPTANLGGLQGLSPVAYLQELGCLGPHWLLTHLVELQGADFTILKDSGAALVSCPRSNALLLNGLSPVSKLWQEALPVSFATDGLSSNLDLDLIEEIRAARLLHAAHGQTLSASRLWEGITSVPAKQVGHNKEIGSLEKGKKADFSYFKLSDDLLREAIAKPQFIYELLLAKLKTSMLAKFWIDGQAVYRANS